MIFNLGDISTAIGIVFIFFTAVTAIMEFRQHGNQRRAAFFSDKVDELWKTESYITIMESLDVKDQKSLKSIPLSDKMAFLNVLEEIAIMMNSGLIKKEVASYMFGYFTIACWESEDFWNTPGLNRDGKYWTVLRNFTSTMKKYDSLPSFGEKNMRF